MGLAWLSLFFSWNVHMVVEAHKVFKKKRQHWHRHHHHEQEVEPKKEKQHTNQRPTVVDIFSYLSKEGEDYSTVIKEIGLAARRKKQVENINRSKSCSDLLADNIQILEHSPVHRRNFSFHDVCASAELGNIEQEKENLLRQGSIKKPELTACLKTDQQENRSEFSSKSEPTLFSEPATDESAEKVQNPRGAESRFRISKVPEKDLPSDYHENG